MYSLVCFGFSFALPVLARNFGRKATHALCLICGGMGLLSVVVIHSKFPLLLSMVGVGIAFASTLSMPFSILSGSLPSDKTGIYMGIFNSFVVIPEITAALGFGWVMSHLLNNNRIAAVVAGGIFFMLAALLMHRVQDVDDLRNPGTLPGNAISTKS
jgi:maltose/moltooligosaccharide transporter